MKRALLIAALLLAAIPVAALKGFGNAKAPATPKPPPRPTVVMPEGFTGKEKAVMTVLFPDGWSDASNAPNGAHLRDARRWTSDGKMLLAVLIDRWAGSVCEDPKCEPQATELAVLETKGDAFSVRGRVAEAAHHGGSAVPLFDSELRHLSQNATVLGVRDEVRGDGRREAKLRLYSLTADGIALVFDRHVESTTQGQKGKVPPGCLATVRSDDFGTPPYVIKVQEHCTTTGKDSFEIWRWTGATYQLHGPPSDAAQKDDFTTEVDEPTR